MGILHAPATRVQSDTPPGYDLDDDVPAELRGVGCRSLRRQLAWLEHVARIEDERADYEPTEADWAEFHAWRDRGR